MDGEYIDYELTSPAVGSHQQFAIVGTAYYKIKLVHDDFTTNWDFCTNIIYDSEWDNTFAFSSDEKIYYGSGSSGTVIKKGNNPNIIDDILLNNTNISFNIKDNLNTRTSVNLYNIKGQLVKTICDEILKKGKHNISWNGLDKTGKTISSGIYFFKVSRGNSTIIKKSPIFH